MTISQKSMLEIVIKTGVAQRYNGVCPVRIIVTEQTMMKNWFDVTMTIPGQSRIYSVTAKQMAALHTPEGAEAILDEVLFAIFLLLDEGDMEDA